MALAVFKRAALSVAVVLSTSAAFAADYSPPQPQCYDGAAIATGRAPPNAVPCYVPPPPPVIEEFSSWYLRGDLGMSNQQVNNLNNALYSTTSVQGIGIGFDSAPIFGLGVGYYFNEWLRFDVTGEYRGRANFHGLDIYGGGTGTDQYTGSKSEWLALGNAYIDLGTWNNLTPFVGAGIGFSRNTISSFLDVNTPTGGVAYGDTASKWNFAWALHAGVSYRVTKNFAVELSYRYVNLGDARSGDLVTYTGVNSIYNPMEFNKITSHDFRIGLRMNLDAFYSPRYAPPPTPVVYSQPSPVSVYAQAPPPSYPQRQSYPQQQVYSQPAPVYAPAPNYAPPGYTQTR
jgi:opacity protein-like surface antigen